MLFLKDGTDPSHTRRLWSSCLTNAGQQFCRGLPYEEELTFSYEGDSLREGMLHYAALVKMDRLPQLSQGIQDFHVWPPKKL